MTPIFFDLIVLACLVLSAAIGFMRGFCNEVFTILGWVAGVIATIYFTPVLKPFGRNLIATEWLADMATSTFIFLVTMGIFSFISSMATKTLHASKLGIVDRGMGFLFGILRAIVLFGLAFLLFAYVFEPENRPDFVKDARTRPFLEASASWTQTIIPLWEDQVRISESDPPLEDGEKPKEKDTEKSESTKKEQIEDEQNERINDISTKILNKLGQ